jgi:iduronate 2-sulfatase
VELAGLPAIPKCSLNKTKTCTEGKSLVPHMKGEYVRKSDQVAFSQYPRPGSFPTKSPNSDKPKLKQIKIMGYSIRTIQFRYTIWIGFNPKKIKRGNSQSSKFNKNILFRDLIPNRLEKKLW